MRHIYRVSYIKDLELKHIYQTETITDAQRDDVQSTHGANIYYVERALAQIDASRLCFYGT